MLKRTCPGCGYRGDVYDFSPSIEIEAGDFRIFHLYNGMKGPLYCNQCKRKHLIKIAKFKNITEYLKSKSIKIFINISIIPQKINVNGKASNLIICFTTSLINHKIAHKIKSTSHTKIQFILESKVIWNQL